MQSGIKKIWAVVRRGTGVWAWGGQYGGSLASCAFSAGLFFSLLVMILMVTSFPHYISYVTNLAEEFGKGLAVGWYHWGGGGGERVDEVLKGGGGCRISFIIILGVKR